jgi:hypothetical protein
MLPSCQVGTSVLVNGASGVVVVWDDVSVSLGGASWEWSDETGAADWIVERLHPFARDVGSVIPDGFEAYVRVFHPARRRDGADVVKVRWAEIASWSGRVVHPEMQFRAIAQPVREASAPPPWDGQAPADGKLSIDDAEALVDLLRSRTSTPERCWFCLWEGYGQWHGGSAVSGSPPGLIPTEVREGRRVELPRRRYYLYRGPIHDATAFCVPPFPQTPNLWWPEDRAWCVATEIDFAWTYVGGSSELAAALLGDRRFEALPATITDRFTFDSDLLNR